ncbi:hypothetical protein OJAV_G00222710 [Oryzias javanicus]|uniref:Uncharacterized protein n=1 Tax=Oryzias javanicus TaxID=123683 RepID=A0A3S2NQ38_ORYJA|nr:hypothetical protein OJAV_G00222710 [Oryzias javanicus]
MEVPGLQEALKVELQCHQKLAVHSCPVGASKPLSLIKPSGQSIAISVVPAKTPVSVVTAHRNGQRPAGGEPLQTSPVNLQASGRAPPHWCTPTWRQQENRRTGSPTGTCRGGARVQVNGIIKLGMGG